jgi:hypothetical protein
MVWTFFVIKKGWHRLSGQCDKDDVDIFLINKGWHELSGEWYGHLH